MSQEDQRVSRSPMFCLTTLITSWTHDMVAETMLGLTNHFAWCFIFMIFFAFVLLGALFRKLCVFLTFFCAHALMLRMVFYFLYWPLQNHHQVWHPVVMQTVCDFCSPLCCQSHQWSCSVIDDSCSGKHTNRTIFHEFVGLGGLGCLAFQSLLIIYVPLCLLLCSPLAPPPSISSSAFLFSWWVFRNNDFLIACRTYTSYTQHKLLLCIVHTYLFVVLVRIPWTYVVAPDGYVLHSLVSPACRGFPNTSRKYAPMVLFQDAPCSKNPPKKSQGTNGLTTWEVYGGMWTPLHRVGVRKYDFVVQPTIHLVVY